jgi:HSP20 family protein
MIYRRLLNVPTWRFDNSFGELERMRRQIDQMYGDAMTPYQRATAGVFPMINLTEDKNSYYVRAELPGIKADELDIQVTANNISIAGERKIAAEAEGTKYHRREREAGQFSRLIGLPGDIDPNKVEANLEDGVLNIVISKAEAAKPKQISVKS